MLNKFHKIFSAVTLKSNSQIKDKEQLDYLLHKLKERKIIVDHDLSLIKKNIIDFPLNFAQACSCIRQIFLLDIEKQIESKINSVDENFQKMMRFLHFFSPEELGSEDLKILLTNLNFELENFKEIARNLNKNEILLRNIRFDTKHFLWERILENIQLQNESDNSDFFITDSTEYQTKMKNRIDYEFEIIRTRSIQMNSDKTRLIKKLKKVKIERVFCADRDIPILCWKVPSNFYDKEIMNKMYFKCEALRELILSKHFQKYTGFDDVSSDEFYYYFFENIEGESLIQLIKKLDLDISENSILFRYLAREILIGLRDLLNKCTYSFGFPISIDNIFYECSQLRLYLNNIDFGPKRQTILQSNQIIEAKLLYFYGIILIKFLAVSKPELEKLSENIQNACAAFEELEQMHKIYDMIPYIEECLTNTLESDVIISIIVESLMSPFKAKMLFDEFYEKKNFLKQALKSNEYKEIQINDNVDLNLNIKGSNSANDNYKEAEDKIIAFEPYYIVDKLNDKHEEDPNDDLLKRTMTINLLLIHPFYSDIKIEDSFLKILFKN